jgi:hypothetical protein
MTKAQGWGQWPFKPSRDCPTRFETLISWIFRDVMVCRGVGTFADNNKNGEWLGKQMKVEQDWTSIP